MLALSQLVREEALWDHQDARRVGAKDAPEKIKIRVIMQLKHKLRIQQGVPLLAVLRRRMDAARIASKRSLNQER